jgi:hypothetical protein
MSKSMFDADETHDYPLAFNTYAQIEAYAEAYADRIAFERGTAPDMHLREPLTGKATVRPRAKAQTDLPVCIFPKPPALPKPIGLPPVPAHLDLGGKWSPF